MEPVTYSGLTYGALPYLVEVNEDCLETLHNITLVCYRDLP